MNSELVGVLNEIYIEWKRYRDNLAEDNVQQYMKIKTRYYQTGRLDGYSNSWRYLANYARPDGCNRVPVLLIEDNIVKILNDIYTKMKRRRRSCRTYTKNQPCIQTGRKCWGLRG